MEKYVFFLYKPYTIFSTFSEEKENFPCGKTWLW